MYGLIHLFTVYTSLFRIRFVSSLDVNVGADLHEANFQLPALIRFCNKPLGQRRGLLFLAQILKISTTSVQNALLDFDFGYFVLSFELFKNVRTDPYFYVVTQFGHFQSIDGLYIRCSRDGRN